MLSTTTTATITTPLADTADQRTLLEDRRDELTQTLAQHTGELEQALRVWHARGRGAQDAKRIRRLIKAAQRTRVLVQTIDLELARA